MKELINRKDIHGIQLKEGDIIAECSVEEKLWNDKGIVKSRPLGVVVVYKSPHTTSSILPEETDAYNIMQIRTGNVLLTDKADDWMVTRLANGSNYTELHLSKYDGDFYG